MTSGTRFHSLVLSTHVYVDTGLHVRHVASGTYLLQCSLVYTHLVYVVFGLGTGLHKAAAWSQHAFLSLVFSIRTLSTLSLVLALVST